MSSLTNFVLPELEQVPKTYRQRYIPVDVDDLTDESIRSIYRFNRRGINSISNHLREFIDEQFSGENLRGKRLTVEEHTVIALKFYAHGTSFRALGEQYGVSLGTISNVIDRVTDGILSSYNDNIRMPTTREQCAEISNEFFATAGIPNVVGCVDGSLIPIKRPSINEHVFVSRKSYHAINAMFVCRPDLRFTYVDATFPGATQDAAVFRESQLRQGFINRSVPQGFLLGDSGYGLSQYLLTPVQNPTDRASASYNQAHRRTRNVIERAFGVMKSRFRCLDRSGGPLRFAPLKCARIINAVALLHNLAIEMRLTDDGDRVAISENEDNSGNGPLNSDGETPNVQALEMRNNIIRMFE